MSKALPELPEPAGAISVDEGEDERTGGRIERCEDGYSADQMQAFYRQAILAERERCANLCELSTQAILLMAGEMTAGELRTVKAVLTSRAAAIRAGTER